MSRRRQSYQPYQPIAADELHDVMFGTRQRRDRSHLTAVPRASGEGEVYGRGWYLLVPVFALIGVTLLPAAYLAAWMAWWLLGRIGQ